MGTDRMPWTIHAQAEGTHVEIALEVSDRATKAEAWGGRWERPALLWSSPSCSQTMSHPQAPSGTRSTQCQVLPPAQRLAPQLAQPLQEES